MPELPRPLTEQEKNWLRQALTLLPTGKYLGGGSWRNAATGEVKPLDPPLNPELFLAQVEGLVVMDQCHCGDPNCHTLEFQNFRPEHSVALVHTSTTDGRELIVFIDEETGLLTELEII